MIYNWADIEQLYQNTSFCPDGWAGISSTTNGDWRLCCYTVPVGGTLQDTGLLDHLNHPDRKAVRLAMLSGDTEYMENICRKCHYQQNTGIVSRRDRVMETYRWDNQAQAGLLKSLNSTLPDGSIDLSYIHMLDIKFIGNQCNLKCFTCKPQNSSSLGVEGRAMGDLSPEYQPVQIPLSGLSVEMSEKFWSDFKTILPHIKILNFTGGEPFMMNAYWDMIDLAIEMGLSQNMELHLSSNVSAIKWNRGNIMDCFAAFKRVRLQASIDGFGPYNNYIRYPSEYNDLISNIEQIRDQHPQVDLVVSSVVSALSVSSIPSLNHDVESRGFTHIYSNVLTYPIYQRVEWLPTEVKELYRDMYTAIGVSDKFSDIMKLLKYAEDLTQVDKLVARCHALDKHRATNMRLLWPELSKFRVMN